MKTTSIRKPAVAGAFYPEDGGELHEMVQRFLREGRVAAGPPKAVIAPHAGYIYSGAVAGSAFAAWSALRAETKRIVLVGPSHKVAFSGISYSPADYFATPLGLVPVDREARVRLKEFPQVVDVESAHRYEHSIETHLPFLQETIGEFSIVPLVFGDASPREISQVLQVFWDEPDTFFSISSDLSHELPYADARRVDALTTKAIEQNHPHDIGPDRACGRLGILALLHVAERHGLHATTLDLRNSGDTAGDRESVVGYGAYAFA